MSLGPITSRNCLICVWWSAAAYRLYSKIVKERCAPRFVFEQILCCYSVLCVCLRRFRGRSPDELWTIICRRRSCSLFVATRHRFLYISVSLTQKISCCAAYTDIIIDLDAKRQYLVASAAASCLRSADTSTLRSTDCNLRGPHRRMLDCNCCFPSRSRYICCHQVRNAIPLTLLKQECTIRGPRTKSGPRAEVLWPAERSRF